MAVAWTDGDERRQRAPLHLIDADQPSGRDDRDLWAERAGARSELPGPARYRRPPDEDDEPSSWLVTPAHEQRRGERPPVDRFMPASPAIPDFKGPPIDRFMPASSATPDFESPPIDRFMPASRTDPRREREDSHRETAAAPARTGPRAARAPQRIDSVDGTDLDVPPSADRPPAEAIEGNRLLTVLLFFSGVGVSVALWLFNTQPGSVNSSATLLIAAGRVTGLIGGYLLFIQLLMMSRVSWLEEWVGSRDLLRWHRWLGTSLVVFVLAHIVFIVYGYALTANASPVAQGLTIITTYEDMISATVATGILVLISLLALRVVRRLLPYELWHLLHLSAYLVLILGYGHQIAVGADMSGRYASVFWPGLGALVAAALIWGRLVEPLYLNLKHRLVVADVVAESDEAFSIYLTGRRLDTLSASAGQFMRWRFLNRNGWWQTHPFSLSAAPNDQWLRLTVTAVGDHTSRLEELQAGTKVWAEGPFGTFTAERRTRRKALLIAGGSGIAPIRALLEDMPDDTVVIYRARTVEDLVFRTELDALARRRRSQVRYVVGGRDDPGPRRLFTPEGLQTLVPDVHRRDVFLCGSPGLVETAVATMRELEIPSSQLHLDPFEF